jgi:hypothetical protein
MRQKSHNEDKMKDSDVGFEVFTAVTMKNAVFWDVSEERVAYIFRVEEIKRMSVRRLLTD